jgi:Tn3 transposase DDE domain
MALYQHQQAAMAALGFKDYSQASERALTVYLRSMVAQSFDSAVLTRQSRIDDRVAAALAYITKRICLEMIQGAGWEHVQRWVQDLSAVHDEGTGETLFEWLRKPTTGTSQTDIADATQRLDVLRALGADKLVLAALPIAGMRHYARCRAIQKVQSLALLREPRRTTEVGCWLRLQFLQLNDVVLKRISRRISEPRRGTKAIGTYSHILDQWPIIYDQAIVLNQRQAGAAIEGVLQQQIAALQRLAVDTHGFTHFAMGLAKVLGFDLYPRLAGFSGRKLYLPHTISVESASSKLDRRQLRFNWNEIKLEFRAGATRRIGNTQDASILAKF